MDDILKWFGWGVVAGVVGGVLLASEVTHRAAKRARIVGHYHSEDHLHHIELMQTEPEKQKFIKRFFP